MMTLPIALPSTTRRTVFLGLAVFSFVVPFALGQSQFLTGSLVNAALFSSAVLLPEKFFLPIILFPSLGVLSRGIILGPLTPLLVYFLPFIWLGNLGLVWVFKRTAGLSFLPAVTIAALAKSSLLFVFAHLFFRLRLVPRLFLQTMGMNQLITALAGGFLAFVLWKRLARS